jgi:hypothetical protein
VRDGVIFHYPHTIKEALEHTLKQDDDQQ